MVNSGCQASGLPALKLRPGANIFSRVIDTPGRTVIQSMQDMSKRRSPHQKNVPSVQRRGPVHHPRSIKVPDGYLITGRNTVSEALKLSPERFRRVFTVSESEFRADELWCEITSLQIPVEFRRRDELTEIARTDSHQGFVAELTPPFIGGVKDLVALAEQREELLLLVLDGVSDPQNFGTILRAAECFRVDGVVWSKNRGSGITPVVTKASVGASEIVPLYEVSNLADALMKLSEAGIWIITSELHPEARSSNDFEFPKKSAIVLGSEGEGVSALVSKRADFRIQIPLFGRVDSLNVSQATAILLHSYRRCRAPVER